ncbi:uncharacterized protein TNCV_2425931 [Trichonephila clavipes]|nr:uncharacterized protein TNCV_2425931 [Trichonephila clavipes]
MSQGNDEISAFVKSLKDMIHSPPRIFDPYVSEVQEPVHPAPIGLTWEHDILVFKPSPCLHNWSQVYEWMGLDKRNSWVKSQVRDSNRGQDIVDLNKF